MSNTSDNIAAEPSLREKACVAVTGASDRFRLQAQLYLYGLIHQLAIAGRECRA